MSQTPSSNPPSSIDLDVDVSPGSESHFYVGLNGDVAHAGIFVATWRDIPVGEIVRIESDLPDGKIIACGKVRWVRDRGCETGPGIGVALEGVSPDDVARIERYCEERPPLFYEIDDAA